MLPKYCDLSFFFWFSQKTVSLRRSFHCGTIFRSLRIKTLCREAHNYYKEAAEGGDDEVRVTMEFPNKIKPKPTIVTINSFGATLTRATPAAAAAVAAATVRAGCK